jgi:molybdenum cofactor cytidylyltransferase
MHCTGILLAAGRGRRFDPAGLQNKLLQYLPSGEPVALRAARQLARNPNDLLVVVHPDANSLRRLFESNGFMTTICVDADKGMGHSLAHGIRESADANGWIIALADMPQVHATTIAALDAAIKDGADIAVPVCQQRRGNPVAFSCKYRDALLQLQGDRGARHFLLGADVTEIAVDDTGIFFDIDAPRDLQKLA